MRNAWRANALCFASLLALGAAGAAGSSAVELAQALQRKYDALRDFSTDFVHVYRGGVLKKQLTEKGRLLVKKPGKMRWEYQTPEPKLFVSDGAKVYFYMPQDKQVTVSTVPADQAPSSPALFLAGRGNLARDFTVSLAETPEGNAPGTRALKLIPKTPQAEYDWLLLLVDGATLSLRGLTTVDAQGGASSFAFTNLKENVGLSDKDFDFKIPRGVDVLTDAPRR